MARFSRVYSPGAASFVEASVLRFSRVYRVLHTCISAHCRVRSSRVSSVPGGRARARERDTRENELVRDTHDEERGKKVERDSPVQTRLRTLAYLETFRWEMASEGILYTTHYYKERGRIQLYFMECMADIIPAAGTETRAQPAPRAMLNEAEKGTIGNAALAALGGKRRCPSRRRFFWQKALPRVELGTFALRVRRSTAKLQRR